MNTKKTPQFIVYHYTPQGYWVSGYTTSNGARREADRFHLAHLGIHGAEAIVYRKEDGWRGHDIMAFLSGDGHRIPKVNVYERRCCSCRFCGGVSGPL